MIPRRGALDYELIAGQSRMGYALVEVVVASLVAGIVLVGALLALSGALRSAVWASQAARAASLAQDLMDEILTASYRDPDQPPLWGVEEASANTRASFDDVDDYDGWTESPPQKRDGTPLAGLAGWQREVTVRNVDPDDVTKELATTDDRGLRRVRVLVSYQNRVLADLVSLKTSAELKSRSDGSASSATAAKPPGNQPPRAVATGTPLSGAGQVTVQFDASASRDPDGDPLDYAWDFGDGGLGMGVQPVHTYMNSGRETVVRIVTLTVSDPYGGRATDRITVTLFPAAK